MKILRHILFFLSISFSGFSQGTGLGSGNAFCPASGGAWHEGISISIPQSVTVSVGQTIEFTSTAYSIIEGSDVPAATPINPNRFKCYSLMEAHKFEWFNVSENRWNTSGATGALTSEQGTGSAPIWAANTYMAPNGHKNATVAFTPTSPGTYIVRFVRIDNLGRPGSASYPYYSPEVVITVNSTNDAIKISPISTQSNFSTIFLLTDPLDIAYYRSSYSDLNAAFGNNINLYWTHWQNSGYNEGRLPYAKAGNPGAAISKSGRSVAWNVVSGPATLSGNSLSFTSAGPVTLRASIGSGNSPNGVFYTGSEATVSFNVTAPDTVRLTTIPSQTTITPLVLKTTSFDPTFYRQTYSDLNAAFGTDVNAYWNHWQFSGFTEGRLAYSGSNQAGAAVSKSGLPISWSVDSGPAILAGSTLSFNGAGTVTLRAGVNAGTASNGLMFTGGSATTSFVVNKAAQAAVTLSPSNQTVNAGTTVNFTAGGGSGSGVYTWGGDGSGNGSTKTITFNTVGNRTVTVYRAGDTIYNQSAPVSSAITVIPLVNRVTLVSAPTAPATQSFTIRVRNTGTKPWTSSTHAINLFNPSNSASVFQSAGIDLAPGAETNVTLSAPTAPGTYHLRGHNYGVTWFDSTKEADPATFGVVTVINPPPTAPVHNLPASLLENQSYGFQFSATDANGDLRYITAHVKNKSTNGGWNLLRATDMINDINWWIPDGINNVVGVVMSPGNGSSNTGSLSTTRNWTPSLGAGYYTFQLRSFDSNGSQSLVELDNIFIAPVPAVAVTATSSSGASAVGGGTLSITAKEAVTINLSATSAKGWLSEATALRWTGAPAATPSEPQALPGAQIITPSPLATASSYNASWTPSGVGTFTLYGEAFTGRSSKERINGISGYPGVFNPPNPNTLRIRVDVASAEQSPVIINPATQRIKIGESITFTTTGGSGSGAFSWGGDSTGTGNSKTVTFTTIGTRTVSVYRAADMRYNQSATANATITVDPDPKLTFSSVIQPYQGTLANAAVLYPNVYNQSKSPPSGSFFAGAKVRWDTSLNLTDGGTIALRRFKWRITNHLGSSVFEGPVTALPDGTVTYNHRIEWMASTDGRFGGNPFLGDYLLTVAGSYQTSGEVWLESVSYPFTLVNGRATHIIQTRTFVNEANTEVPNPRLWYLDSAIAQFPISLQLRNYNDDSTP